MKRRLIEVNTIRHDQQRYATWADWMWQPDHSNGCEAVGKILPVPTRSDPAGCACRRFLKVDISDVGDWRYHYLSFQHEFLEATICKHLGISQAAVDAFDIDYEARRMRGERWAACGCEITDDPGSDVHAPYRIAHLYAESVEYGLAKLLGVDPKLYDAAFIALDGGVAGNGKE